jgi:hypothetical protein
MTKTTKKFSKLTAKQAAYWLSEAWGRDISAKDVRVRNNWVFVRDKEFPDEADVLFSPHGADLHGEPWSGVKMASSPFIEKNKSAINKLCAELDSQYKAYLIESCDYSEDDWQELKEGAR